MNLRKILHVRSVASIAHLHSPEDDARMLRLLRERQPAGPQSGLLATILEMTRRRGPVLLAEAREASGLSANRFEAAIGELVKLRHGIWVKGVLVLAPFSMDWGSHTARLVMWQSRPYASWKAPLIVKNILRRPDHGNVIDVLSPRFMSDRQYSLGPTRQSNEVAPRTQHKPFAGESWVQHAKVGSTTPATIDSIPDSQQSAQSFVSLHFESHASQNSLTPFRAVDTGTPVNHLDPIPAIDTGKLTMDLPDNDIDLDADGLQVATVITGDADDADWSYLADFVDGEVEAERSKPIAPSKPKGRKGARRCEGVEKPRATAKRSFAERPKAKKAGEDDQRFCAVWIAHQRRHEKWGPDGVAATDGAFGMAGAGSRSAAWTAWQDLSESQQIAAARDVEATLEWRAGRGLKLQMVLWYIKDRSWEKRPKPAYPPISLKITPPVAPPVRPAAGARPAPAGNISHRLGAVVNVTTSNLRPPPAPIKPKRATFSEAELAAYCREVGIDYSPRGRG